MKKQKFDENSGHKLYLKAIIKRGIKSAMYDTLFFYYFRPSECGTFFFSFGCFQPSLYEKSRQEHINKT